MDRQRAMRTTTAAAVLAVAALGSTAAHAGSRSERTGADHYGEWRIHQRTWQTTARLGVKRLSHPVSMRVRSRAFASRLVSRRLWSSDQFRCLDSLWTRESNWNHLAYNRWSGAYGIPQALPGDKMGLVGWDWRSNPRTQIRWGLKYIKGRYGSPCGAWGHFRSHNWY
ncbi:lytic transglycosylase domain-containing protein [Acrocarpospora corrugata]|uniref:aggregation-promoting factor C-terminal-like domain-containing protein n=1 Tax=Acrocarpospora corrugata TaxID=35763 RepID=UPI001C3FBFFE|nr:lytic transglycosylase domain-containing protein [Acrocarpospora corrugata]